MKKRIIALGLAVFMLAACTSLPDSSAPQAFDVSVPDSDPIQLSAQGPTTDSDPVTLVTDFLLACAAGVNDDFATARLFLTSTSAHNWNPTEQVLVYDTATRPLVAIANEGAHMASVSVNAQGVASVDAAGVLTPSVDSQITTNFTLVKENDQWRIEAHENLFIISQASFEASYKLVNLYFPATTGDGLVPDPRWYPSRRLAAHMMKGLVAGPEESIAPAVTSAIPSGTTIHSNGIDISESVARVSLDAPLPEGRAPRALLQWQVARTLTQDSTVSSVELSISGEVLPQFDVPRGPSYLLDTKLALSSGAIGTVSGVTLIPLLATSPEPGAASPAMSPVSHEVLAWREGGDIRIEKSGAAPMRITEKTAGAPSIDRFGYVWAASGGGAIAVRSADGHVLQIPIEGNDTSHLASISISPDGARALIVRSGEGVNSAWIGTVTRSGDGTPTGIVALTMHITYENVVDATWAGGTSYILATKDADDGRALGKEGANALVDYKLGGFGSAISIPEDILSVSAGGSSKNLCVLDVKGATHCRSGALWQDIPAELREVRFPG